MPTSQNKAGLYLRVSTPHQVDKDSLKSQEERLISYCKAMGIKSYQIYEDAGHSAKNTNRPALERLLRDIKQNKINCVFVTKLDRITRSIADLLELISFFRDYDVNFVSITESIDTGTAMGRFMQHLLGLIAQLEREITAERVSIDMRQRAINGKWNGGVVPYGYMTQKLLTKQYKELNKNERVALEKVMKLCSEPHKLYINPEESDVVNLIFETFLETKSIRKTTIQLNSRGFKTRKDQLWSSSTIHRILSNPLYIGKISYGKRKTDVQTGKLINQDKKTWTLVKGEHDAIISKEIFEKTQAFLSKNTKKPTKPGRTYLLSGILKCGLCGGALSGHTYTKKKSGKAYSYYKCSNKHQKGTIACKGMNLPVNELENFIIKNLFELSDNEVFLKDKQKMISILKSKTKTKTNNLEIKKIEGQIKTLKQRLDTLIGKLERGLIEDEDFQPRYIGIKSEINSLVDEQARVEDSYSNSQIVIDNLEASFQEIASFSDNWEYLDNVGKALRIQSVVKEIRATKEEVKMYIYLDKVANVSHTDMDSLPPPA